jgi:hypothetical protein
MAIVSTVAGTLQALLGLVADQIAQKHSLIQRQRRFTASTLLSTFVLGYLHKPTASVADLAATAESLGVSVTPQAIDARFQPALQHTLHDLWQHAVTQLVSATPRAVELLQRFTQVRVGDSTTIALDDCLADLYPGCGGKGSSSRAALKIQVQWDLLHGTLAHAAIEPGRQPDATSPSVAVAPPAGTLVLYDLGYFALDRFADWDRDDIHWISKGLSNLMLTADGQTHDLIDYLQTQTLDRIDRPVHIGAKNLACRLIALRVPEPVAARRRRDAYQKAAKKGRRPSAQRLAACDWTVYLTNCPPTQLATHEVEILYRLRWQIELLFKLWKSHNRLADHRSDNPVRQLIELFARLIAVVVQHWLLLTTGWADPRLSLVKASRLIRERMPLVIEALGDRARLEANLTGLVRAILNRCRINNRRQHPNTAQLLQNPRLQYHRTLT